MSRQRAEVLQIMSLHMAVRKLIALTVGKFNNKITMLSLAGLSSPFTSLPALFRAAFCQAFPAGFSNTAPVKVAACPSIKSTHTFRFVLGNF